MSTRLIVVGYRESDEQWRKMCNAWKSCADAGIEIPEPVLDFFEGEDPEGLPGKEISLGKAESAFSEEWGEGVQIDIEKLPAGLRYIRAYISY